MSRDVNEVVTNHCVALVTDVRQLNRYECDENNVEDGVQRVGKYCEHYCERRGE